MNSDRLQQVFEESLNDSGSVNLNGDDYEARMKLGVKIMKDKNTNEVVIFDHSKGGNYYVEMNSEDLQVILDHGWTNGILKITLEKYKAKLERIKNSIATELNGNKSSKRLNYFKEARQQILNKYYKVTQKLNKQNV